ncbi:MAG: PIN domain-containing protein [Dehalococcoidia bacterium]
MKVLLDTNIIIHREAATVVNEDIGVLFKWLDNLHYSKCIHHLTIEEIEKHQDPEVRKTFEVKLRNYNILKTTAPIKDSVYSLIGPLDKNENDVNDTIIINELFAGRVDILITEDKKIINKASILNVADKVYTIDSFLEKVTKEHPNLTDYKVLSVRKSYFGNLKLSDDFFNSFIEDYPEYTEWFNKKADEPVYICLSENKLIALLYLKVEDKNEIYSDINPPLLPKKRLKIGSFKVVLNGYRLGERFLKIVFDNALLFKVEEIYVSIFDKRIEQQRLINLLEDYGFRYHGVKVGLGGKELVYVRSCEKKADRSSPKLTYPFFSVRGRIFIVSIYPKYHTELFPDSILQTESPADYVENEPYRNAISKVFISRSMERGLSSGDVIVFYRTADAYPAYYHSVVTTIGVVENVITNIKDENDFIELAAKRSVFSNGSLSQEWKRSLYRPFIVNFLYVYSLPKRINLQKLIEIGVIPSTNDVPRGFTQITVPNLKDILKECQADESIAVN